MNARTEFPTRDPVTDLNLDCRGFTPVEMIRELEHAGCVGTARLLQSILDAAEEIVEQVKADAEADNAESLALQSANETLEARIDQLKQTIEQIQNNQSNRALQVEALLRTVPPLLQKVYDRTLAVELDEVDDIVAEALTWTRP